MAEATHCGPALVQISWRSAVDRTAAKACDSVGASAANTMTQTANHTPHGLRDCMIRMMLRCIRKLAF